jgi:hypothetical protein
VALPGASRDIGPAFDQHRALPVLELPGGRATILLGEVAAYDGPRLSAPPFVARPVPRP